MPSCIPRCWCAWCCWSCGSIALLLGIIGIVVPGLPTTPFILVAAACYARASERFYRWLLRNPTFGPLIIEWRRHHSIPFRVKWHRDQPDEPDHLRLDLDLLPGHALAAGNAGLHRHLHCAGAVAHSVTRPAAPAEGKICPIHEYKKGSLHHGEVHNRIHPRRCPGRPRRGRQDHAGRGPAVQGRRDRRQGQRRKGQQRLRLRRRRKSPRAIR
jgi:hypothetical protein